MTKNDWAHFTRDLRRQDLIKILGPELKEPLPKNFQINDNEQLIAAQLAHVKNIEVEVINRKIIKQRRLFEIFVPIIGSLVGDWVFRSRKMDPLGIQYAKYLEALEAYKEVLIDVEEERLLEIRRKEAEYWFMLGGFEFEEEVSRLFQKSGHFLSVIKTKGTGDGGVDIILTTRDNIKIFVQCKAHKKPIGPHVARDFYGAMQSAGVTQGIIICLGGTTQGVKDFVSDKNISLIDINGILKMQKICSR